jgi:hypothetical protein
LPSSHCFEVRQGVTHPGIAVCVHPPVSASQASVVHGLPSSQETAVPVQVFDTQTSPRVQGLPSSQAVPSGAAS